MHNKYVKLQIERLRNFSRKRFLNTAYSVERPKVKGPVSGGLSKAKIPRKRSERSQRVTRRSNFEISQRRANGRPDESIYARDSCSGRRHAAAHSARKHNECSRALFSQCPRRRGRGRGSNLVPFQSPYLPSYRSFPLRRSRCVRQCTGGLRELQDSLTVPRHEPARERVYCDDAGAFHRSCPCERP